MSVRITKQTVQYARTNTDAQVRITKIIVQWIQAAALKKGFPFGGIWLTAPVRRRS